MSRPRADGHDAADRRQALRAAQGRQLLLPGPAGERQPVRVRGEAEGQVDRQRAQLPDEDAVGVPRVAGGRVGGR